MAPRDDSPRARDGSPSARERKEKDGIPAEQTKSAAQLRYLKIFREFDASGAGFLSSSQLRDALNAGSAHVGDIELQRCITEVMTGGEDRFSFPDFYKLITKLSEDRVQTISKSGRLPRMYMSPQQFDQYRTIFRECAGEDGQVRKSELQEFFKKHNIDISPERVQGIMSELDDDQSGGLGETEFMTLLAKALGLKKRKIGPGLCDAQMLKDEGWLPVEIKKAGYEVKDLLESQHAVEELLPIFTALDFARAGVPLSQMVSAGWDCARAKEAGYNLADMVSAGCSMQRIRDAGFDDEDAATALRKQGISAAKMKSGGWLLSDLTRAGYPASELRLAGYSTAALSAMQRLTEQTQAAEGGPGM
jgi:Ca2+-binding EF-hand superfamily protein